RMRRTLGMVVLVLAAVSAVLITPSTAGADAPALTSGNGITVSGWRWITSRTFEVDISTAKVSANAVNGPHRVRVTLPATYFNNTTTRFPVLYLLHGGAGGNSAQWTTGGGDEENITRNASLITVMPDGGKVGWFTNWVDQSQGAQAWRDFYIDQVIPWIDGNLRTIASKSGRAIAGLSMGGFGAIRFAQDRPDLFAYAASFSGAVDLSDPGTKSVISQQAGQNGYNPSAPFGNPYPPFDTTYQALNPVSRAARLQGVAVGLWVGSGSNNGADPIEQTMANSALKLHNALTSAGVPHFYWNYGVPGPSSPYGCDGGHDFSCWNFALNDALPRILAVLQTPATPPPSTTTTTAPPSTTTTTAPPSTTTTTAPPSGNAVVNSGFESAGLAPWVCSGTCGADHGTGNARSGTGNGWARNTSGWNDVDQTITVTPNHT